MQAAVFSKMLVTVPQHMAWHHITEMLVTLPQHMTWHHITEMLVTVPQHMAWHHITEEGTFQNYIPVENPYIFTSCSR
jgi:hypothetical protein